MRNLLRFRQLLPLLLVWGCLFAAPAAAADPPRIRPYAGIGVLRLAEPADPQAADPLYLYREPGIYRIGVLHRGSAANAFGWVLGRPDGVLLMIATARKGEWLRVVYDDAGREAWLAPQRRGEYQSWDVFLKTRAFRPLPGLRKQYYQLCRQPGGEPEATLTPRQLCRVLRVEGDWVQVMVERSSIGWLRWRDEDGRLLMGLEG